MARWYWYSEDGKQIASPVHPKDSRPIAAAAEWVNPALVSDLHNSFALWAAAGRSPGPVIPRRIWIDRSGRVAVRFGKGAPQPLPDVGAGEPLAQWLALLSKWMDVYVVLARARSVWSLFDLAAALPFTSPCLLPRPLAQMPPDSWEQVARGLAAIVAEGELPSAKSSADRVSGAAAGH